MMTFASFFTSYLVYGLMERCNILYISNETHRSHLITTRKWQIVVIFNKSQKIGVAPSNLIFSSLQNKYSNLRIATWHDTLSRFLGGGGGRRRLQEDEMDVSDRFRHGYFKPAISIVFFISGGAPNIREQIANNSPTSVLQHLLKIS